MQVNTKMNIMVFMENQKQPNELAEELNFRKELKRLRLLRGWKQKDLAERMVCEGWQDYNQTTVSRLESNQRPITLAEARTLARILQTPVGVMIAPSKELRMVEGLYKDIDNLKKAESDLYTAAEDFDKYAAILSFTLKELEEMDGNKILEAIPEDLRESHKHRLEYGKRLSERNSHNIVSEYAEENYSVSSLIERISHESE